MGKVRANRPLADVNVVNPSRNGENEIVVCFMPDPLSLAGEGKSSAVLAIDTSVSMRGSFGFGGPFGGTPNFVEMVARKINEILCGITKDGTTHNIYWAQGIAGDQIEEIGSISSGDASNAKFKGPQNSSLWGRSTKILPAIKYIESIYEKSLKESNNNSAKSNKDSPWLMGVIITDGIIEDDKEAFDFCKKLGKKLLAAGTQDRFKLVLIGVGPDVDKDQLAAFDDMFEGTDMEDEVDLWSSGSADEMQDEEDILAVLFGELMSSDVPVADWGTVIDSNGEKIQRFEPLPGKFRFSLPKGETSFTIQTPRGEVTQDISEAF
jgi:hypothetical protein